jgi:hypothetical protein
MTSHKFKFNRPLYQWEQSGAGWKLMRSGDVVAEVAAAQQRPPAVRSAFCAAKSIETIA